MLRTTESAPRAAKTIQNQPLRIDPTPSKGQPSHNGRGPQNTISVQTKTSLSLNTGRLVDHPDDKSSAQMIAHMLELRAAASRGATIEPGDLVSYGNVSSKNGDVRQIT